MVGWLGVLGTAAVAGAATAYNIWLLPRVTPGLLRPSERSGPAVGIISYPLAILWLVLLFHDRLEVVAAAWGVLAFGDGMATLSGRVASSRLPWNQAKSWLGSISYWIFGTAAAALLILRTSLGAYATGFVWSVCAIVVLGSALLESLPLGLDDNLVVPLLTALGLRLLLDTAGGWESFAVAAAENWLPAVSVNLILGLGAYWMGGMNAVGTAGGMALGAIIYVSLGPTGFLMLVAFYTLSTVATHWGFERKHRAGLAQTRGGRRSLRNVLANGSVAAACALLAATGLPDGMFVAAFAAAIAAATGDTLASEIGQLAGGRTRLITSFAPVSPGTEGGVSLVGTVAGALGCTSIASLGVPLGLYEPWSALLVAVAAVGGMFADSVLGASLERKGYLDNEAVNFSATLFAALMAFWLCRAVGG